jgi:hypothetical protein
MGHSFLKNMSGQGNHLSINVDVGLALAQHVYSELTLTVE